jgi:nucleotide-binding universal stress UspA family protein
MLMTTNVSHILLATDGSEGALQAAKFVAGISGPLNAKVTVITVHNDDALILHAMGPTVLPAAIPETSLNLDEIRTATEKQAANTIIADTQSALGNLAKIEIKQLWGHAAEVICNYARDHDVDLVVIGSRGRSKFVRLLLGSVCTQVAQHSPCPVTIVHGNT